MNIKGEHILDEEVSKIWPLLQDQEVLARIAPGISRIEKVSEDNFKAISDISIGPVRGSFEGELSLTDKVEQEKMTLILEQKSKIGNAQATIVMHLASLDNDQTKIIYNGKAKVSGRLATMGQRILGGVISTLSKQVFKELEAIVEERKKGDDRIRLVDPKVEEGSEKVDLKSEQGDNEKEESSRSAKPKIEPIAAGSHNKSFIQKIIDKILSIWK